MKTRLIGILTLTILLFASCSSDNNHGGGQKEIASEVKVAFDAEYPGATNVDWKTTAINSENFAVAIFDLNGTRANLATAGKHQAWYSNDKHAHKHMYERDINYQELPKAVRDAFEATEYSKAPWEIDDVEEIKRSGVAEIIYAIELGNNQTDIDLYYDAEGILIRIEIDNDNDDHHGFDHHHGMLIPSNLPQAIQDYITANHASDARIVDIDIEKADSGHDNDYDDIRVKHWEVDIIETHNLENNQTIRVKKELNFNYETNAWILSEWELKKWDYLPKTAKDGINKTEYTQSTGKIWTIDDEIDIINHSEHGMIYKIEFERNGFKDMKVYFDANGDILKAKED